MNIAFLPNFMAYAVFLKWDKVYSANHRWFMKFTGLNFNRSRKRAVIGFAAVLIGLFALLKHLSINEKLLEFHSDLMLHEVVLVSGALVIVGIVGLIKMRQKAEGRRQKHSLNSDLRMMNNDL